MEAAIERSITHDLRRRTGPLTRARRRWHVRTILFKCGADPAAEFLLEQACRDSGAMTQIRALHMLPDDRLLALHREIDRHRECAEQGATPHGFVLAWHG